MMIFEEPVIEVLRYVVEDVVTASGTTETSDPNDESNWTWEPPCL